MGLPLTVVIGGTGGPGGIEMGGKPDVCIGTPDPCIGTPGGCKVVVVVLLVLS